MKRCGDGISRIIDTAIKLHEPNYRDLFLAAFHSHKDLVVDAEASNRKGRTDLKISSRQSDCTFIYEFKLLTGATEIKGAINQIIDKYSTSTNRYNGIVFINRWQQDLSSIMNVIKEHLDDSNVSILDIRESRDQYMIELRHCHKRDIEIICLLTIFVFDIQP